MESSDKPLKPWQALLAAVLLLPLGLWLGWRGLACFNDAGHWWRGRVRDSFVEAQARVGNVWAAQVKSKSRQVAAQILIQACYRVDGTEHCVVDVEEKTGPQYGRDFEEVEARAEEIRRTRTTTRVFYDPANPGYAVLRKENLPGFFRGAFMAFLGCMIELVALALVAMGVAPILMRLERFLPKWTLKSVRRISVVPAPAKPALPSPREPASLTGNDLDDYYSRALRDHALGCWEGFYCDIFLMPDGRVVVVHDETPSHHYVRTWSVEDVLAGRADTLFDDNQREERESFERRIRQQHG